MFINLHFFNDSKQIELLAKSYSNGFKTQNKNNSKNNKKDIKENNEIDINYFTMFQQWSEAVELAKGVINTI